MIKINNLHKADLLFFVDVLQHYLEVLNLHTTTPEGYRIQKSIAKTIIKHAKGKQQHLKKKERIFWQFNEHQAIVFCNALLCYKASVVIKKEEKFITNLFFTNINHQLKYYEKAS